MAGVIKINPAVLEDKRDAAAVAWNEALRLFMEDTGFEPEFNVTPEQDKFFADTAYAAGGGTSDEKGGNVLGKLSPTLWGEPDGKPTIRADTRTGPELDAALFLKRELASNVPTPMEAANAAVGNQIPSSNPVVNLINQAIAAAGTFGAAMVASTPRGKVTPITQIDGREIPKALADKLETSREKLVTAWEASQREKGFTDSLPTKVSFLPDRAYRRTGGTESLEHLLQVGRVQAKPFVKDPKMLVGSGKISLQKNFGTTPYYNEGSPAISYRGPITIEVAGTKATNPEKYKRVRTGSTDTFMMDSRPGGTPLEDITRILHDDGTVIYSRERDGRGSLQTVVRGWLDAQGAKGIADPTY